MSDSLRKVLLGALIGALMVGFAWHVAGERAKRAPVAAAGRVPAANAATGAASAGTAQDATVAPQAVAVVAVPARLTKFALEIEALGTARANESIDVTAKISNQVTAVRFKEGQQV